MADRVASQPSAIRLLLLVPFVEGEGALRSPWIRWDGEEEGRVYLQPAIESVQLAEIDLITKSILSRTFLNPWRLAQSDSVWAPRYRRGSAQLCPRSKGASAILLATPKNKSPHAWCPNHGWIGCQSGRGVLYMVMDIQSYISALSIYVYTCIVLFNCYYLHNLLSNQES